jgi:hypothetical protein
MATIGSRLKDVLIDVTFIMELPQDIEGPDLVVTDETEVLVDFA